MYRNITIAHTIHTLTRKDAKLCTQIKVLPTQVKAPSKVLH